MKQLGRYSGISALALIVLAVISARGSEGIATKPLPRIAILDDCDPVFKGKAAYGDNLTAITGDGQMSFRVSGLNGCETIGCNHQIAIDVERGWIWVSETVTKRVLKYDFTGKQLLSLPISANALAVDTKTGYVWILVSNGTIHSPTTEIVDADGQHIQTCAFGGFDIAYDAAHHCVWLAGENLVKANADNFAKISQQRIASWSAASLAVNTSTGGVWIAVRQHPGVPGSHNEVLGFDSEGILQHSIPLGQSTPFHVAVNPKDGSVWITQLHSELLCCTSEGKVDIVFPIQPLAAEVDSETGDVWMVLEDEVVRVNPKGETLWRVKHASRTNSAWIGTY